MKFYRSRTTFRIIISILTISLLLFIIINTIIANNVISSMADVRVEVNAASLSDFELEGKEINVKTSDDIMINAHIIEHQNASGIVLLLHGMHGMDASSMFKYARFIYDAGYTAIPIDMRAHGKSEGDTLSFGYLEVKDVIAVIDYLKSDSEYRDIPIILYGLSMGGSTAINTAAISDKVEGLITISAFSSYQNQVSDYMIRDGAPAAFVTVFQPFVNAVLWNKFNVSPIKQSPINSIEIIEIPTLIIHSRGDTQTSVHQAQELFENSGSDKTELWIVEGEHHLIVDNVLDDSASEYRGKIEHFLSGIH